MARGRKPSGKYANQTAVFSTRMTPALRQRLDRSAEKNSWSLTQEVEDRLRKSFEADDRVKVFGGPRNYAFLRILSLVLDTWPARTKSGGGTSTSAWLDDPYRYHQVEVAIRAALSALRPKGRTAAGDMEGDMDPETLGWFTACLALEAIRDADPTGWNVASRIKQDMGSLLKRIPADVRASETIKRAVKEAKS